MKKTADVVIIGGGISGLMMAHTLSQADPTIDVVLLEKGHDLKNRKCPILEKKVDYCIDCTYCAIMEGLSGAGAYSDGKYIISTEYGGWLTDFYPSDVVIEAIEQADDVLQAFGATAERYFPDPSLKQKCLMHDLHIQSAQVKHLGTDHNKETMLKFIEELNNHVTIIPLAAVSAVDKETHEVTYTHQNQTKTITGETVVFAVGRSGSDFFSKWCQQQHIPTTNNQVDIGVRVELPYEVWSDFSQKIYEPKIWYRSKKYNDKTRMFCFNEKGHVVVENTDGIKTVNGHSYKDPAKQSKNSNFALLNTIHFTTPFDEPIAYARYVAKLANMISGNGILVQRLGDLMQGRRTTEERLKQSSTIPTCHAVAGDLSLCIPKRQLDNILETILALDKVAPGTANEDTLLYGVECKYYSARPKETDFVLDSTQDIYAIGDGAGFTRSLSHAAAHGILVSQTILEKRSKEKA
jgi:uncharacterized FAD-dependent dehydrogenase